MVPALLFLTIGAATALAAAAAMVAFCLAASSVYLLNDTADRDQDRLHPTKRNRPIASGLVRPAEAIAASALLASAAVVIGWMLSPTVAVVIAAYVVLTGAYSLRLKHIAYVDVAVLASGFVLRVVAGAVAVHASAPPLLLVAVFAGAAFLALGKRRAELALLGGDAATHRRALSGYRAATLEAVIGCTEYATVLAFALWVLVATGSQLGLGLGMLSAASLAYTLRTQRQSVRTGGGGNPTRDLFSNLSLLPGLVVTALVALSTGVIR
ncbi:MAG: UbiA family prenyltransferase [Mycobacteriaceae bacterium]